MQYLSEIIATLTTLTTIYYGWVSHKRNRALKDAEVRRKAVEINIDVIQKLQEVSEESVLERTESLRQLGDEQLKNQHLIDQVNRMTIEIQELKKVIAQYEKGN